MKNTYKRNIKRNKSSTRKKVKNKTKKMIKKDKKSKSKNKTIKLKQRGGGPLDFIYWLLEKFLHLIMYGWFPRQTQPQSQPQNEEQNEQQNEPQNKPQKQSSNQLSGTIRNTNQQHKYQIETSWIEKIPREDIVKWDPLQIDNPLTFGQKFKSALDFFVNHPCKYILSIHGTSDETEASRLFKLYNEREREGIIEFLFNEYKDIKDIRYEVYSDDNNPIIIFYNIKDIQKLVKNMNHGLYNKPISKYIMINADYKIKEDVDIDKNVENYFQNITLERLLELPFIWRTTHDWKNDITEILDVISTKILFGNLSSF